jgi:hypothetical protein
MAIVNTSAIQGPSAEKVQCFASGGRFADGGLWTDTDDSVNSGTAAAIAANQSYLTEIRNQVERPVALKITRSQYGK